MPELMFRHCQKKGAAGSLLVFLLLGNLLIAVAHGQTFITVDPAARHQQIQGWECVTFAAQDDPSFPLYRDQLFERIVNEAGINRLRLELRSGAENAIDYFAQYQSGQVDYATWRANRYATVNDNADPNVIAPAGFHFTELDRNVETTVMPLRALAAAKGQLLYINLNYVAFTSQIAGGSYHHQNPAEYAEFILAAFQHLQQRFGFVPDAVEILLEPDNVSQWNGTILGNAIVAVETRLRAAGYSPEIIAPSCTHMGNAVTYFDALAAVPGALAALDEICYHRYGGVSDANLQALAARGQQHNKRTSMLEWWSTGNGIDVLFKDLTIGRNSAWQQGVLAGIGGLDDDMGLYKVDVTNPTAPVIQINRKTRIMRQVYRFVRRGAVRIGATATNGAFLPLAFINPGGEHVVVIRTAAAGTFAVGGLPPGSYGMNYSTASQFNVSLPNQTVASGSALTASIPAPGALTVYQLRPRLGAAVWNSDTLKISIVSLAPGFSGTLQRTSNLLDAGSWLKVVDIPSNDFRADCSEPIGIMPAFYRFKSP